MSFGSLPVWLDPTSWAGRKISPPVSEDIGTIQSAIAAQLTEFFSDAGIAIPVHVFPDFDLDTWWGSNAIAFVLISYHGSRFGAPMSTDAMVQERVVSFDVHVEARQTAWALTGPGSVYALIDAVEAALGGFRAPGCRNAYFVEERFGERDPTGHVWLYDMRLEVPTLKLKQEPQLALANLVKAQAYVAASASARGRAMQSGTFTFASGTLTLPGPTPIVVGAITSADGRRIFQEFADWTADGTTGVVTAVATGAIAQNATVQIAFAAADTVTAVSTGGSSPTNPAN